MRRSRRRSRPGKDNSLLAARIAFLVGNQNFRPDSGLAPLRGPHNDVGALSRILGDLERGKFEVHELVDKPRHEILPEIEQALTRAAPGDLVLIYYSGHGKLDRNGRVCLATADTREGALQATSIPARHLTDLVNQSDCDQVVLMLDCCYSGAVDDLRGDVASEMHVLEDARGFYILTASTETQTAKEAEPRADGTVMGRFTAALVDAIESGAADAGRKGRILLSDLRRHLEQAVTGQTPQFFARRASGDPLICLSPTTAAPLLDEDVLADLSAESWHRRLGAVSYLLTTMREGPPPAREAALARLERHLPQERDVEVRKRIEEGLYARQPVTGRPEPLPPRTIATPSKYMAVAAAIASVLVAGGGLLLSSRTKETSTAERVASAPPPQMRPAPSKEPQTDQGLPGTSRNGGAYGTLITRSVDLLPGANAARHPPNSPGASVDWFIGAWTRLQQTDCGYQLIIDRIDEENAAVRPHCSASLANARRDYPKKVAFANGVLTGPVLSALDRFEPITCPEAAAQGRECLRQTTSEKTEYTYVKSGP